MQELSHLEVNTEVKERVQQRVKQRVELSSRPSGQRPLLRPSTALQSRHPSGMSAVLSRGRGSSGGRPGHLNADALGGPSRSSAERPMRPTRITLQPHHPPGMRSLLSGSRSSSTGTASSGPSSSSGGSRPTASGRRRTLAGDSQPRGASDLPPTRPTLQSHHPPGLRPLLPRSRGASASATSPSPTSPSPTSPSPTSPSTADPRSASSIGVTPTASSLDAREPAGPGDLPSTRPTFQSRYPPRLCPLLSGGRGSTPSGSSIWSSALGASGDDTRWTSGIDGGTHAPGRDWRAGCQPGTSGDMSPSRPRLQSDDPSGLCALLSGGRGTASRTNHKHHRSGSRGDTLGSNDLGSGSRDSDSRGF